MRFFLRIVAAVAVLGLASPSLAAGAGPVLLEPRASESPRLTFGEDSVRARDLGNGHEVAWLSVSKEFDSGKSRFVHRKTITAYDAATGAAFELGKDVPVLSTWVAVNLTSGLFGVGSPEGFPLRRIPFPPAVLFPGKPDEPDFISDTRRALLVMLVRKTEGAWTFFTGDGSVGDADGRFDGRVTIALADLEPLGDAERLKPPKFLPEDVVLVIDAYTLDFYGARVRDLWEEDD